MSEYKVSLELFRRDLTALPVFINILDSKLSSDLFHTDLSHLPLFHHLFILSLGMPSEIFQKTSIFETTGIP